MSYLTIVSIDVSPLGSHPDCKEITSAKQAVTFFPVSSYNITGRRRMPPFSISLILKKINVAFIGESSQQHVKNQPAATDHCSCFAK
jgi:hypothetical protein